MLVKVCKKAVLVFAVVMLLASTSMAAPSGSALVGGRGESSELTKTILGGIEVTYEGLWKHTDTLEVYFSIVLTKGGRVAIDISNMKIVDAADQTLGLWGKVVYINDKRKDIEEFAADQPYKIVFRYHLDDKYLLTPTYKTIFFVINGFAVEFNDVPAVIP